MKKTKLVLITVILGILTVSLIGQTSIRYGDNLLDAISCAKTDTFLFLGNSGDEVLIQIMELSDFGGVCGRACLCFDQQVELLDSDNNVLAVNSSPTSNNTPSRYRTKLGPESLPEDGTYKLAVRDKHNNGRGEYSIFVQNMQTPKRADTIYPGQVLLENLNRGEVNTYLFEALPFDQVIIDLIPDVVGNVDPILELYNPLGQPVALPDSGHIEYTIKTSGTFKLLAFSRKDESGTYNLCLDVELQSNNPPWAKDDSATTVQNTQVAIDVLVNDSDPENNNLTIVSVTLGNNGSVLTNGRYVVYTPDEGFAGADSFFYEISDLKDIAKAKVTVVVTSITGVRSEKELTSELVLGNNFPNPFKSVTRISYELPEDTNIRLMVYNMLGQKVATLVDEYRMAGQYEVIFDATGMKSGIYWYVLEVNGNIARKRMILLK